MYVFINVCLIFHVGGYTTLQISYKYVRPLTNLTQRTHILHRTTLTLKPSRGGGGGVV